MGCVKAAIIMRSMQAGKCRKAVEQTEGAGVLEAGVGVAKIGMLGLQVGKCGRQLIALL